MGKLTITDFYTYRWRYAIGYIITGLLLIGILIFAGFFLPGGLSQAEMATVVKSSSLSIHQLDPAYASNLPYLILQKTSLWLFGVTLFSIKLPSLILGLLAAIGMIILLRKLFAYNVAVLASVVTIATGQFIYIAQSGTPSIIYIVWSVWLLVAATMVAQHNRFHVLWKVIFFITAALSLYTPLSIYMLIALGVAIALHPHLRFIIRRLSRVPTMIAIFVGLLIVAPLLFMIIKSPQLGLSLLGIPSTWPDFGANIATLGVQFFGFIVPTSDAIMTPIFGFGSMALILFGLLQLIRDRHATRSYVIFVWLVFLIPILLLNPNFTNVTFLPFLLLMAVGIQAILYEWYKLFPLNPYARVAGLIPLVILIGGLVITGIDRYGYGYHYDPLTVANFNYDLPLLNRTLDKQQNPVTLAVSPDEQAFYQVVADNKHNQAKHITVTTTVIPPKTNTLIVAHSLKPAVGKTVGLPSQILTTDKKTDADRFYIYKNTAK